MKFLDTHELAHFKAAFLALGFDFVKKMSNEQKIKAMHNKLEKFSKDFKQKSLLADVFFLALSLKTKENLKLDEIDFVGTSALVYLNFAKNALKERPFELQDFLESLGVLFFLLELNAKSEFENWLKEKKEEKQ